MLVQKCFVRNSLVEIDFVRIIYLISARPVLNGWLTLAKVVKGNSICCQEVHFSRKRMRSHFQLITFLTKFLFS